MTKKIRKAVLPVAGLGTRFLPATKSLPKELLPIVDKPLIQYAVEEALEAGIEEFIFVTGRGKSALEDHFDIAFELEHTLRARNKDAALKALATTRLAPGRIVYTRQQEPLGLGHAVLCAKPFVGDEPFAVMLPDDLVQAKVSVVRQMVDRFEQTGGNVVAGMDVPREHTQRSGVLAVGADDGVMAEVTGMVEKPAPEEAPSTLSVIGRYVLMPEIFDHLENIGTGAGGEIQLTDAMAAMIGQVPFHGYRFEGTRFDCGDKQGFVEAQIAFALDRDDIGAGVANYISHVNSGQRLASNG